MTAVIPLLSYRAMQFLVVLLSLATYVTSQANVSVPNASAIVSPQPFELELPMTHSPISPSFQVGFFNCSSTQDFNTSASLVFTDISLSNSIGLQLILDIPVPPKFVTIYGIETIPNYPPIYHNLILAEKSTWTLPALTLPTTQDIVRTIHNLEITLRMPHSFVGTISIGVHLSMLATQTSAEWMLNHILTWQPAVVVPVPMLDPVAPTPLVVGSVNATDIVSFGSSGQLALSDIVLGAPDMLRVDFHAYG
ncbi:hypothetical protein As57867_006664, partial [Aphanomyces stellatus]